MAETSGEREQVVSTPRPDVIPLPTHLSECGCPHAERGRHLTACRPAREHDAIPLSDRPGYAPGQRFQGISWEYPLRLNATVNVTVEIDPFAYIAAHQAEYDGYDMEPGYQAWEKPMCFLSQKVTEDCSDVGWSFGGGRYVSRVDSYVDEVTEYPRWTREDTERLHAVPRAPVIDPNQGDLFAATGDTDSTADFGRTGDTDAE